MENATIGYKGMSSVPSDYLCEDGDMKLAVDAEVRDGSYHATRVPKNSCFHVDGFYPKFYHEPSDGKKYFIGLRHDGDKWVLAAYDKDGVKVEIENAPEGDEEGVFGNFCAMGNLVCLTVDGGSSTGNMKYIMFSEGYYMSINIGDSIRIEFPSRMNLPNNVYPLKNQAKYSRTKFQYTYTYDFKDDVSLKIIKGYNQYQEPTDEAMADDTASDFVFAAINTIRNDQLAKLRFIYPRIIQYAIKMYSGNYVFFSPRILVYPIEEPLYFGATLVSSIGNNVPPNMIHNPSRFDKDVVDLKEMYPYNLKKLHLCYNAYSILMKFDKNEIANIKHLSDKNVIAGIDVFMSGDIINYRTKYAYALWEYHNGSDAGYLPTLTKLTDSDVNRIIEGTPVYLAKSFTIDELLKKVDTTVELFDDSDSDVLKTLEQQTQLDYSNRTSNELSFRHISVYNSRLIASYVVKHINQLGDTDILCTPIYAGEKYIERGSDYAYQQEYDSDNDIGLYIPRNMDNPITSIIMRDSNGNTIGSSIARSSSFIPLYFNYNTSIALSGGVFFQTSTGYKFSKLKKSDINNTFFFIGRNAKDVSKILSESEYIPQFGSCIIEKNLIKASNVNDPFTFKDGNSCECGNGSVMAVASMSSPTSQGQFGQYPLFAFCTDGIYAIGIGSDGTIQNCTPYSTDILAGEEALANVGRDIVFASKAGVMSIGEEGRSLLLPAIKEELYGYDNERQKTFVSKVLTDMGVPLPDTTNVYTYITNGVRMAYDYQHGRVILYNPNYGYSYVMDAQSKSWSIMTKQFKDHLNPVAECLMVAPDGQTLHDYSTDEVVDEHGAFLMTRPFKMEAANVFKTIHSLIQRGNLRSQDAVQQALYGSRDLVNWVPIWSSKDIYLRGFRGTGYKYFRLLVFLPEMTQNDGIDGATISYLPRETDQQR